MSDLYIEHICSDCLQYLVNDEYREDESEEQEMINTLNDWACQDYFPLGLTDETESEFRWEKCPLCKQLPGDRYAYYFKNK